MRISTLMCGWLRPVIRVSLRLRLRKLQTVPRPVDPPLVITGTGPHGDRVLLIGDGPAIGYGVVSHTLALPGHLSRQISEATGRPATVKFIGDDQMTVSGMTSHLANENLQQYRAVVMMVGLVDAATFTPVRRWTRHLNRFIDAITEADPGLHVVAVAVPPLDTLPTLEGLWARLAAPHARSMNQATRTVAARYGSRCSFLPFFPQSATDSGRHRSPESYAAWAKDIVPAVLTALERSRASEAPAADALEVG